jgi:hypothetical protein
MEHKVVGTVELLRTRVYPLDPEGGNTSVVVEPEVFPLYRVGDAYYWVMTGRRNSNWLKFGDGLFASNPGDRGDGPPLTFPSPTFGPEEWAALLDEPAFTEGHPEQRLWVQMAGES